MAKVKVAISGAGGRMGRRLVCLALKDENMELVGVIEHSGHQYLGKPYIDLEPNAEGCKLVIVSSLKEVCASQKPNVLIDFSSPIGTVARCEEASALGVSLVIGTTGLNEAQNNTVSTTSSKVPVIHAMNYSLGVNLMFKIAAQMAKALGDDFNIEITEAHHNKKVDAPSGTAYGIADSICAATERTRADLVHGREGQVGKRTSREIGMHALRLGSVVGDHTVFFGSDFERLEFTHRAQDRDVFAFGALRAAKWLCGQNRPAKYDMQDVLFGGSDKH